MVHHISFIFSAEIVRRTLLGKDRSIFTFTIPVKKSRKKPSKGSRKPSGTGAHPLEIEHDTRYVHGNFGDWDTRLTNCQHYIQFHRGATSCQDPMFDAQEDQADLFHQMHMDMFHKDPEHPGFCIFDEHNEHNTDASPQDDEVYEYEQALSFPTSEVPFLSYVQRRHRVLAGLMGLKQNEDTSRLFALVAMLTDPISQPMETDTHVISLELLSQLITAFEFDKLSITPEFDLSTKLFLIVESSLRLLNCHDEVKLRSLNNSDAKVDWRPRLQEWTPHGINDQDLRLIYMIDCVCIYTIYKLYAYHESDLCLNPFLEFFLKLWKVFTNVVLLGLEIDRRVEPLQAVETPRIVRHVIRGSSTVRYVLATILNDDVQNRIHDFEHLNIHDLLSPYGRRCGSGALFADVRWYVGAMLALGSELNEVVETLVDLEPNDRYDEDIKYIFMHEYEDFHHEQLFPEEYEGDDPSDEPIMYVDQDGNFHRVVKQRCSCQFFDEEETADDEPEESENEEFDSIPQAVRSEQTIEFDDMGRDWRDVTRGGNIFFNTEFPLDDSECLNWKALCEMFETMMESSISETAARSVIKTVARSVKMELENDINRTAGDDIPEVADDLVTTDKIYEKWSSGWVFEAMLALNPEASYAMLDEMFMANGYRRVLIWFITHLALSFSLMNYVLELVTGLRGETRISKKFKFSRQGSLILSDIEKSMLLHEFFNNCLIYLSKTADKYNSYSNHSAENVTELERCLKIVKLVCLMVNRLLDMDSIDMEEYKIEISSLLINWIGIAGEAKDLFFRINNTADAAHLADLEREYLVTDRLESTTNASPRPVIQQPNQATMRHRKFLPELKEALSNVIKKLDNGTLLFRPFFELIENTSEDRSHQALDKGLDKLLEPGSDQQPLYVPGELKPIVRDEQLEHERAEQAMLE